MNKITKKVIIIFLLIICLIGFFFSLYKVIIWTISIKSNNLIKDDISSLVSNEVIESDETLNTFYEGKIKYNINFDDLKSKNSDTVGYININNTNISYVVVKGDDNSYYLNHNFEKKWSVAGWIFADYHNRFDGTDKNIVIYGHKMRDGSMFAELKNTLNEDWYLNSDNHYIAFTTPLDTFYYKIYSIYTIEPELYYINTIFNNENEFSEFLKITKGRSIYDFGVSVDVDDQVLTLSSCMDAYNQRRVVVHAKKIKKYKDS